MAARRPGVAPPASGRLASGDRCHGRGRGVRHPQCCLYRRGRADRVDDDHHDAGYDDDDHHHHHHDEQTTGAGAANGATANGATATATATTTTGTTVPTSTPTSPTAASPTSNYPAVAAGPSSASTNGTLAPASTTVPASSSSSGGKASAAPLVAGPAFTCTNPTNFLSQGTPTTQLYYSLYGSGTVTYTDPGIAYSGTYNALGLRPANDYLYAVVLGGNTLLQIDSTGAVTSLGAISGYTAAAARPQRRLRRAPTTSGSRPATAPQPPYEINVTSTPPAVIGHH